MPLTFKHARLSLCAFENRNSALHEFVRFIIAFRIPTKQPQWNSILKYLNLLQISSEEAEQYEIAVMNELYQMEQEQNAINVSDVMVK